MNNRAFTLSLIVAALAVFMVYSYIEGRENEFVKKYGHKVPVVVASRDINELEVLDDRKITMQNIPKNYVAPGAYNKKDDLFNTIAVAPILKGEQITAPRVTFPGQSTGLSRQISIGKRAISVRVSEDQAVSKLLKPGDRVDVLAMIDYAGGRKEFMKVKTVLQDVLVLSTGLSVTNTLPMVGIKRNDIIKQLNLNTYSDFGTITLELDPYQVQKIIFLERLGSRLSLALRNNDDKKMVRIQGTRLFDILGEDAAEAKAFFSEKQPKQGR